MANGEGQDDIVMAKPCPCGEEFLYSHYDHRARTYWLSCPRCGRRSGPSEDRVAAIDSWNATIEEP